MFMTICKPCLEKSSKTRAKFISYLQGFHIIAISVNTSKYDFLLEFGNFFQNRYNEQLLVNSSKNVK